MIQTSDFCTVKDVPIFVINFRQKRFKLAIIKSMKSNEVHNRHHNFHNMFILQRLPHGDCWWMRQWRSVKSGFSLPITHLILPIKPVFFPSIRAWSHVCFHPPLFGPGQLKFLHVFTNSKINPFVVTRELLRLASSSASSKYYVMTLLTINNWAASLVSLLLTRKGKR
jgi:hypothetical protein